MIKFDVDFLNSKDLKVFSDVDFESYRNLLDNPDIIQKFGSEKLQNLLEQIKAIDTSTFKRIDDAKKNGNLNLAELGNFLEDLSIEDIDVFTSSIRTNANLKLLEDYLAGGNLEKLGASLSNFSLDNFLENTRIPIIKNTIGLPSIADVMKVFSNEAKKQIDAIFDEYTQKLDNIEEKFKNIKSRSTLQGANKITMTRLVDNKITNMKTLLQDPKKDDLKAKVDEKTAKSVGTNNDIKSKDVTHSRAMISGIPDSIKELFQDRWNDIKDTIDNLDKATQDSEVKSNDVLKESVTAGRPAVSADIIKTNCASYGQSYKDQIDKNGGGRNFDKRKNLEVPSSHPPPSSWSNLRFVVGNVLKMTTAGRKVTEWGYHEDIGYYGTDIEVLTMANEVGKMLGKTITISSAYRPPEYNRLVKGAKASQHLKGKALDCLMAGINRTDFVNAAKAVGFRGIGYYRTFIHIDVGPARTWG